MMNYMISATERKRKVKYYAVGEYGSQTFRPHYHAIITNLQPAVLDELSKIWGKGHVSVGTPDVAAIHYTTKYVIQPTGEDIWTPLLPPFSLISKGMGKAYLYTNGRYHKETQQNFVFTDRGKYVYLVTMVTKFSTTKNESKLLRHLDNKTTFYIGKLS